MQNVGVSLAKILGANGLQIALWTLGNALLKRMKTMSEDGVGSMVLLRPIIRKTPYPQWMGRLFFSRFVGARPLQTVFVPNGCLCFPLKRGSGVELVGFEPTSKQGNHTLSTRLFRPSVFVHWQDPDHQQMPYPLKFHSASEA